MGILRRNQIESRSAQLPEIGRLRKGSEKIKRQKEDGTEYLSVGKDLEYFRFTPDDRLQYLPSNTHENLLQEIELRWQEMKEVTCGWKSIPILLPYKSIDANFTWRNAVYDKSGRCTRRCDGVICDRYTIDARTVKTGKAYKAVVQGAIDCAMKEGMDECPAGCKAEAKLSMIIPGLYPGLVLLTTRSLIDIQTIQGNLKGYERFDLSRIPMRLCRSLRDASYWDANGEYHKQEKWLLHIEIDPQYGQLALQAQQEQYKAELMGVPVGGVRSLPSAPVNALPAYEDYLQNETWILFQKAVSEAVRSGDMKQVERMAQGAMQRIKEGKLPKSAEPGVVREWEQAIETIGRSTV